jgi:hypothetical protein
VFGAPKCGQLGISDHRVDASLKQLQSSGWPERSAAFYAIVHAGLDTGRTSDLPVADGILAVSRANAASRTVLVQALTHLLDQETDLISSNLAPSSEDYSTYYGDVIQAVTTLRDSSSTRVLIRCINTGNMALTAVAGFGEPALSEAINLLPTADVETRSSLFRLFSRMTEPRNIANLKSAASHTSLLNALLIGSDVPNPFSRIAAAQGLARISSPTAIQAVSRLAAGDSFTIITPAGAVQYPVRDAAVKALRSLTRTPK